VMSLQRPYTTHTTRPPPISKSKSAHLHYYPIYTSDWGIHGFTPVSLSLSL
jgi:hypothetical protein